MKEFNPDKTCFNLLLSLVTVFLDCQMGVSSLSRKIWFIWFRNCFIWISFRSQIFSFEWTIYINLKTSSDSYTTLQHAKKKFKKEDAFSFNVQDLSSLNYHQLDSLCPNLESVTINHYHTLQYFVPSNNSNKLRIIDVKLQLVFILEVGVTINSQSYLTVQFRQELPIKMTDFDMIYNDLPEYSSKPVQ